jgi:hypothetical protein
MGLPARRRRPRLPLLDANIVIEAHCLGIWEKLTRAVEIVLPSTVADEEVQFYEDPETGDHIPIDRRGSGLAESDRHAIRSVLVIYTQ